MIKINKWSETFENADTRKRQRLGWFLCPTGNDSKGYRRLMKRGTDGVEAFAVYMALCQLTATTASKERGGFVHSNGVDMDFEDLSDLTRMPEESIRRSMPLLVEVGWVSEVGSAKKEETPTTGRNLPPTADSLPPAGGFVKGEGEGEGEVSPLPSMDQATTYALSAPTPIPKDCVEAWHDSRTAAGWINAKDQPIQNWQADLRGFARHWMNNEQQRKQNNGNRRSNQAPQPGVKKDWSTDGLKLA